MSDTLQDNPIQEAPPKKKRGFAAHKPDCQCRFHRRQRGEPVGTTPKQDKAVTSEQKTPMDTTLDYFQYSLDPGVAKHWQSDETLSPLHLEKGFTDRYNNLAFKYISTNKINRLGKNFHGWEIFHDSEYPEGRKLGNDLILAAKPKEDNEDYKARCVARSEANLRRAVEASKAGLMPGQDGLQGSGAGPLVNQVMRQGGRVAGTGIEVGVMRVRQHPQEPRIEPAKKTYFVMGGKS